MANESLHPYHQPTHCDRCKVEQLEDVLRAIRAAETGVYRRAFRRYVLALVKRVLDA